MNKQKRKNQIHLQILIPAKMWRKGEDQKELKYQFYMTTCERMIIMSQIAQLCIHSMEWL